MKKAYLPLLVALGASFTASAQSLGEIERLQRRAALITSCEELVKHGTTDEACRELHLTAPARSAPATAAQTAPHPSPARAAETIDVLVYRAAEINGKYDQIVEVALDGQPYPLHVGDTAKGWKLVRLTDYEAEFAVLTKKGKTSQRRVIGFRAPAAPSQGTDLQAAGRAAPSPVPFTTPNSPPLMPISQPGGIGLPGGPTPSTGPAQNSLRSKL